MPALIFKSGKNKGSKGKASKESGVSFKTTQAEKDFKVNMKKLRNEDKQSKRDTRRAMHQEKMQTKRAVGKYQTMSRSAAAGAAATSGNVALASETVDGGIGTTPRPNTKPNGEEWEYDPHPYQR